MPQRDPMDVAGRLAALETNLENVESKFSEFSRDSTRDRDLLRVQYSEISRKIDKQSTFMAGVITTMTAIWAVIVFFKDWVVTHLK